MIGTLRQTLPRGHSVECSREHSTHHSHSMHHGMAARTQRSLTHCHRAGGEASSRQHTVTEQEALPQQHAAARTAARSGVGRASSGASSGAVEPAAELSVEPAQPSTEQCNPTSFSGASRAVR
jgi:hypothetical protein